jgi:hypothetical protein
VPKIKYLDIKMGEKRLAVVEHANNIIAEYAAQGFTLTLRQLYYQFVSRDLIRNSQQEYKKLGDTINDARLAGLVDWLAIIDRTRNLRDLAHWNDPAEIVSASAEQFRIDKWANQKSRIEVWIEKDALVGVIEGVCEELDVPYFSCRGYTSQSEMWVAAQRLARHARHQHPTVLHFGDHDPSGIDMSRDIEDRLTLFGADIEFVRVALNQDQVDEYEPPPNPAKTTDSRYASYITKHGDESWELDALEPSVIAELIRTQVVERRDGRAWAKSLAEEERHRKDLTAVSRRWDDVTDFVGEA